MNRQHRAVVEQAQRLAAEMPLAMAEMLADAIGRAAGSLWASVRQDILQGVAQPHYRALAGDLLDAWESASDLSPQAVALALHTAAVSEQDYRERYSVELVWTGPDTQVVPLRQTEQVILQVIESARERLTVVSYAVYRIPRIREALVAAANRGVGIRLIVETPNRIEGQGEYDCLIALGNNVASAASVYFWPQENRATDDNGKIGILHVKCAVADGHRLFLSSANLTEYAFTINMELGLLVTGGQMPGQVERHFEKLIEDGTLIRV